MSEINPYEYLEETIDVPYASVTRSEPQLPLRMQVVHKTGFFTSKPAELLVTEEHLELISPGLVEPVLIARDSPRGQIKFRLLDMILTEDDGKKHRLIYPKKDPEKYLKLARLETWYNARQADRPDPPEVQVVNGLKKWTPCMVKNWLTCLAVLQGLLLIGITLFFFSGEMPRNNLEDRILFLVLIGWIVFIFASNVTLVVLLHFRQFWALNLVIVFYVLFFLSSLLGFSIIGMIIAGSVIYYASVAKKDYARLSPLVGAYADE